MGGLGLVGLGWVVCLFVLFFALLCFACLFVCLLACLFGCFACWFVFCLFVGLWATVTGDNAESWCRRDIRTPPPDRILLRAFEGGSKTLYWGAKVSGFHPKRRVPIEDTVLGTTFSQSKKASHGRGAVAILAPQPDGLPDVNHPFSLAPLAYWFQAWPRRSIRLFGNSPAQNPP